MENAFDQLEDKVRKAAEVVKRLRHENRTLQDELGRIRPRLQEVDKKDGLGQEVKELRAEREEIRRRIAKLVQVLDALDPEE